MVNLQAWINFRRSDWCAVLFYFISFKIWNGYKEKKVFIRNWKNLLIKFNENISFLYNTEEPTLNDSLISPVLWQTRLLRYSDVDDGFVRAVALLQLLLPPCGQALLSSHHLCPRHNLHRCVHVGQVCCAQVQTRASWWVVKIVSARLVEASWDPLGPLSGQNN